MPQNPESPKRWRALMDLSIEPRGETPLYFKAGDEVKGALPEGWPKKAIVDQEWVEEITDDGPADPAPSPGPRSAAAVDEKGVK